MSSPVPVRLRAEHVEEALGIGTATPRLSWGYDEAPEGFVQESVEVEVSRPSGVTTHTLNGPDQVLVAWPASPLASRERAEVRLRVPGGQWSEPLAVEAGLLSRDDWVAEFVTPVGPMAKGEPAPVLRGVLDVPGEVVSARLYATAMGLYVPSINAVRVGDLELAPGWTAYQERLRYQTYDVTDLVREGRNSLELLLGRGWWHGRIGFEGRSEVYGPVVAGLAQLEVTLASGETVRLATDATWTASPSGIVENTLLDGQATDLRPVSGETVGVEVVDARATRLVAPEGPPVRVTEVLEVASTELREGGVTRIDTGQNLVGWLRLRVRGENGAVVSVRHAEVLEHDELGTRPLRTAKATDTYVLTGEGEETLEPCFTFHGFRYAEVSGAEVVGVEAVVVGSDLRRTGWFSSSHEMLDQFHRNVVWGMRGNFVDVPTDCPQRDERLGWTGDIQVFSPTASFLYDSAGFLTSWLADLAADQTDDGIVGWIVPDILPPGTPATAAWGDAGVIVPWVVHEATADLALVSRQLPSMRGWVDHVERAAGESRLWRGGFQFGDWLDPDAPPEDAFAAKADPDVVATGCFARCAWVLSEALAATGDEEGAARYGRLADEVVAAFRGAYVTPSGRILSDCQTVYAMAICWDLVDDAAKAQAGNRLADLVRGEDFRISTGFVGTPLVTEALGLTGHVDTAYRLLLQTACPSWLYAVTMGATTVWERWDSMLPDGTINPGQMTSFNHYALGAVADWLHRSVGGLAPAEPGYRRVVVRPLVGTALDCAQVSYDSAYGHHAVSWTRSGTRVELSVTVPVGTTAEVWVPGTDAPIEVGPGQHAFTGSLAPVVRSLRTIRDVVAEEDLWPRVVEAFVARGAADDGQVLARRLLRNFDAPVSRLAEYASPPFKRAQFEPALAEALAALL
ncbi:MAG TPA: family 78 glycoside hydrolase catalytic domain [Propionibacteriaceae bacterium]|nr:family 78 glycoside hydrolase catalytic domain [Propionibacteriaceae bacterium]